MKAEIEAIQLKKIITGTKYAVGDESRPMLSYIKLDIKKDRVTGYACNGFCLAKVVVENTAHIENNEDEFTAYIKPFTVPKSTVDMIFPVEITNEDGVVTVAMQTKDGKTELSFPQPSGDFIDAERLIADAEAHDRKLAVNGVFVAGAMKAIAGAINDKNNLAIIETKEDNNRAFLIKGKGECVDVTQLVLPVRLAKE